MSFDYDKIKNNEENSSHWASYSDLFMVLSLVFLLLYVVANLRSGTSNIQNHVEYLKVSRERDDLKEQIKAYNTLKNNYLQTGASQSELKMYESLMDKISLLKEEAKTEKEKLLQASQENKKKELALNKYQQMIRNVINSNMVSQSRIKRREKIIVKQDETLSEQTEEIKKLETTVEEKQNKIEINKRTIARAEKKLEKSLKRVKAAYKKNKMSKKRYLAQIRKIKKQNQTRVAKIKEINKKYEEEIQEKSQSLEVAKRQLASAESQVQNLEQENKEISEKVSQMRSDFKSEMEKRQQEYDSKIANEKLTARQKILAERKFREEADKRKAELESQIEGVKQEMAQAKGALKAEKEQTRKLSSLTSQLKDKQKKMSKNLARLEKIANSKKKIIDAINKNLKSSGIKASVDQKSGDVVIDFGGEYFDTGKASIKPGMEKILKKFMPAYSKSLFSDKNTAKHIKSVEIIGYASPTYKGKYVNPKSLKAGNKEAVNYNLDLSYYRARSIFNYIFDTEKMKYKNQRTLLPMVKVTGKSFLASGAKESEVKNMTHKEYCAKYDCKKSQRVSIRFNLKD